MRKANQLAIEVHPADNVAQTITLDVSQFPVDFSKLVDDDEKATKPHE